MIAYLLSLALSPPGLAADVRDLGHDRFRTREAASARLLKHGDRARPFLARVARDHRDAEVRRRAEVAHDALLARRLKGYGKMPYLDMLWYDVGRRGYNDEHPLKELLGRYLYDKDGNIYDCTPGPDDRWPTYRVATAVLVSDLVALEVPDFLIRSALKEMARREKVYLASYEGKGEVPPPVANAMPPAP